MKNGEDVFDQKIWALLSGQLQDRREIQEVAQLLNDEFLPRVMGVLKKIGVDEITAEEIAKEAVDRAVRAFRPGIAKFLTFTTRIALNIRIDRLRKGSLLTQRPEALDDNLLRPQGLVTNSEIPITEDDIGERSEFMKKIDSVIHLISQEDRVLIQFDIQDVPKESYMQIFNISKEAYRQRKSRAYHKLQELIQPKKEGGLIAKGV